MSEPVSKGGPKRREVFEVAWPSSADPRRASRRCSTRSAGTRSQSSRRVPQTTRNRIRGIVNRERGQLVFIDTPGSTSRRARSTAHARASLRRGPRREEILYVVDASRQPGEEELALMRSVADTTSCPGWSRSTRSTSRSAKIGSKRFVSCSQRLPDVPVVEVSALKTGDGLTTLLEALFERAPEGEAVYPRRLLHRSAARLPYLGGHPPEGDGGPARGASALDLRRRRSTWRSASSNRAKSSCGSAR